VLPWGRTASAPCGQVGPAPHGLSYIGLDTILRTVDGRSPVALRLFPFALAFALAGCGGDASRPPTTTVSAATATEASPATTEASPSCAELEQRKQDLEDEKKEIDERKRETSDEGERDALEEQKKEIEEQKQVLDEELRACRR
jgi:Skp family chaperone for outer membrane proteins